jgi:hypothetical protein
LQTLEADDNLLTAIPPQIGDMPNLNALHLSRNRLTDLPPALHRLLSSGLTLGLEGNPLRDPLPDLAQRGLDALAAYLSSLTEASPLYEAKIMLVGDGSAGKTSLVASLLNAPFEEARPTTHGIEIRELTIRHPSRDLDMKIRTWDFGGQEIYRITHQFFFTPGALYLLVWNARVGEEQSGIERWLRTIRLRIGDRARVLLVATHSDERRPEIDYPRFQRLAPAMLGGQYTVDNRSGAGVAALREAIAKETALSPQMGLQLSADWVAVRDALSGLGVPQITFAEFAGIADRHNVGGAAALTLIEMLHDLGQVIYYGDDTALRNIVVLSPDWLTRAIGYVLEDRATREAGGILEHRRLPQIWDERADERYAPEHHAYFLRLMEKFDISYRLPDDSQRSLVAQLVPHERAQIPWDSETPLPEGIHVVRFIFRLSEPAPGLIAWLTVRHHNASVGMHWRRGVFLRYPAPLDNLEALLELRTDNELAIEARGASPEFYANVLRDSVEYLIRQRWPGLSYQLRVPCPGTLFSSSRCPASFSLDGLLRRIATGGSTHYCLECGSEHDIASLLTGLRPFTQSRDAGETYADVAAAANRVREMLKTTLTSEVNDCPRLFTLSMERPTARSRFFGARYRLVLWCEHPGAWHPWAGASYTFRPSREWLANVASYASLNVGNLTAIGGFGVSAITSDTGRMEQSSRQDLAQMRRLSDSLPHVIDQEDRSDGRHLTRSEREGLRELRTMLFRLDPNRTFAGLSRVTAPSGEYVWVCPRHLSIYDPGLPMVSG